MKKTKNNRVGVATLGDQKGITLIALIITIIVMLILVAVSINVVIKSNILNSAKNAGKKTADEIEREANLGEVTIDGKTYASISDYLEGEFGPGKRASTNKEYTIGDKTAIIPEGFTLSGYTGNGDSTKDETTIEGGLVIYDIPAGVTIDWTDETQVNTARTTYNQFVWIPVQNINELASETSGTDANGRKNYQGVFYTFSNNPVKVEPLTGNFGQGTSSIREPDNLNDTSRGRNDNPERLEQVTWTENLYQENFNKMVESVAKYKGFYIGRYETSFNGTTAQSKQGELPMNNLNWWAQYDNSLTYSKNNSNLGVTSEMIWACQWEAMLRFILNGTDADHVFSMTNVSHSGYTLDETPYECGGTNYHDRVFSTTYGDKASNIYDIEGNVMDWTQRSDEN